MAKLSQGLNRQTVGALRGYLDFYYWKGIPVIRKWPDYSNFVPRAGTAASNAAFAESRKTIQLIVPQMRDALRQACIGKRRAWVDAFTRRYMHAWKLTGEIPPTLIKIEKEYIDGALNIYFETTPNHTITGHLHFGENPIVYETGSCRGAPDKRPDENEIPEIWIGEETPPEEGIEVDNITVEKGYGYSKAAQSFGYTWDQVCSLVWPNWLRTNWSGGWQKLQDHYNRGLTGYPPWPLSSQVVSGKVNWIVHFSDWYDLYPTIHPTKITIRMHNYLDSGVAQIKSESGKGFTQRVDAGENEFTFDVAEEWQTPENVTILLEPDAGRTFCCSAIGQYLGYKLEGTTSEKGMVSLSRPPGPPERKWTVPPGIINPAHEDKYYIDYTLADGTKIPPMAVQISAIPTKAT